MREKSDAELLDEYARHGTEAAFAELVRRYSGLVYAAAARLVVDQHLAEDVTQAVFVALARNARTLRRRNVLSSWLHVTARNLAAKTVRTEVRRRTREQEATTMPSPSSEPESIWTQIAPHLDDALAALKEPDRDALMLRFFEHKTAREIGERFGLGEEAAQKRVERALDRLRSVITTRGVTVSALALAGALSLPAVHAAPPTLAISVSASALAGASGTGAATGLTTKLMETIMAAKLKFTIAALVVAGAVATPVILSQKSGDNEEAEAILRQSGEKIASYKTWSADWRGLGRTPDEPQMNGRMMFQAPNLMRFESPTLTIVHDPDGFVWHETNLNGLRKVMRTNIREFKRTESELDAWMFSHPTRQFQWFREFCEFVALEKTELNGQSMHVLEGKVRESAKANPEVNAFGKTISKLRLSIGAEDGFLHRVLFYMPHDDTVWMTCEWHNLKFNEDLPANLFQYTPPAGVEVIDMAEMRGRALQQKCQNHLRRLGLALLNYADAHGGRLPDAKRWWEVLIEAKLITPDVLTCPSRPDHKCAYNLNVQAGDNARQWRNGSNLVLLFEGQSRDATGDATALPATPFHGDKLGVVLADGSVKFVTLAEGKALQWQPAPVSSQ